MHKLTVISAIFLLFTTTAIEAAIINVPEDQRSIQGGIGVAEDGDTVLVQPGIYEENLDIRGHSITIASLTLMTGDPAYIDSTIIDGQEQGAVVNIDMANNLRLRGFVIRNGVGDRYAGGIKIRRGSMLIEDMIIRNNTGSYGGAISCYYVDTIILRKTIIENNRSNRASAGIYFDLGGPDVILEDVIFRENIGRSVMSGGSISLNMMRVAIINNECEPIGMFINLYDPNEDMLWENVTIAGQTASELCVRCGILENSSLIMRNCIVYGNENDGVAMYGGSLRISYSLIAGGEEAILEGRNEEGFEWGEGNIDEDPQFVNPDNGDYHLTVDSPCIDAGDPDGWNDPDGTRADMGAFFFFQGGVIQGFVFDHQSEQPLAGAVVAASFGDEVITDEEGFWRFSQVQHESFDLMASKLEYNDSTLIDFQLEIEDTVSVIFNLLHAELEPSIENIAARVTNGDSEQFDFSIGNPGNGVLEWSVEARYRGDAGAEPWELRQSLQIGEQLDDAGLYGVAFTNDQLYVSGSNKDLDENGRLVSRPTIYVLNREGALIDTFAQPGEDRYGMKDLAFDGELIWGVVDDMIYGITLEGEVVTSFDAPYNPSSAITWDSDREILWIGATTSPPVGYDREGNQIGGLEIERNGLYLYGLAYYADDANNAPLYILSKERDTNRQAVYKHSFETGEKHFVTYLDHEAGGTPQGAFITDQFDGFSWVFMSMANNANRDRMDVWQLEANMSWAILDPVVGEVNPDDTQALSFTIDAVDLAPLEYPAELIFSHNGFGLQTAIPIDLTVTPLEVDDSFDAQIPTQFEITAAYPNPFNSSVRLNYTVPIVSKVSIKLFDITGSLVVTVTNGMQASGQHSVIWEAAGMPSGIYFARMESKGFAKTVKLMLMK